MEENYSLFDIIPELEQHRAIKSTDWKWTMANDYPPKNGLKVFSCFACGGGSTMGYKLAGCEVLGCCEIDKRMNDVYVANHHPKYNFLMDIREFNKLPNEEIPEELFNLDILDGSPPCTTFSMAGQREETWGKEKKFREGQASQTLDDLSFVFIETVGKLNPKVVIMENVEGLLLGEAFEYVRKIYKQFKEIGYKVNHWLLKGEQMGVPQTRHRVFFVAIRDDIGINPLDLDMSFNYEPITYGEIKDGKGMRTTPKMLAILNEATESEKDGVAAWNRLYNNGGNKRMFFNTIICHNNNVFPTVSAGHNCLFDYENKTAVSSADITHAQTFPEDYKFIKNTFANVNYICGMSVPPIMIKRIVTRLIEQGVFDYAKPMREVQTET